MDSKHCSDQAKLVDKIMDSLLELQSQSGQVQAVCLRETIEQLKDLRAAIKADSKIFRLTKDDVIEFIKLAANIILALLNGNR